MRKRLMTRSRTVAAIGTAFAVAAALTFAGTAHAAPAVADADIAVVADDPRITMEVDETSEWAVQREGLTVLSWGFAPDATVTIAIDDTVLTEDTADANGDLNFGFTVALAPGEHVITLTSSEGGSASHAFTIIADEVFYDEEYAGNFDPAIQATRWVVTESELAAAPIGVTGSGFPNSSNPVGPTTVDVVLDGEVVETVRTDIVGSVSTEIAGPLSIGAHEVSLVNPVGQASQTIEVVADAQGSPPAAGSYLGSSVQTHADGVELDDQDERPFRFEIDADGRISGIQGEYWWFCAGGSGFKDLAASGFPATAITADRPFEIQWSDYVLYGTVHADGTASGMFWDGMGECGSSILTWGADLDGELPGPVYDPEVTAAPASLTESELADGGVRFDGSGFAPESEVTVAVAGVEAATEIADAEGDVTFVFTSDALGAGTHEAVLSSADGEARVTFTVTEDEPTPDPETIPGTTPSADDLDPALEGGIAAPSEARAGESITVTVADADASTEVGVWLFGSTVYLGTHVLGDGGDVVVTIPEGVVLGEHLLGVWGAPDTQLGWTTITVVNDADSGGADSGGADGGADAGGGADGGADTAGGAGAGAGAEGNSAAVGGELAATGSGEFASMVGLAALLLAGGLALLIRRRRAI